MMLIWILGCKLSNKIHFSNSLSFVTIDTTGQVEIKELNLAREVCPEGSLSNFCYDGFEQPYRSYPFFVHLNFENFMRSYDSTVYILAIPRVLDTFVNRGVSFRQPWDLDTLFKNTVTELNTVSFKVPNSYKRKINRYQKKFKSKKGFDGTLSYSLYKMKIECVYGGKRTLIVPEIERKKSEGIITYKFCDVYYITDIISIQPITKIEY
jgi:hypothetical protein